MNYTFLSPNHVGIKSRIFTHLIASSLVFGILGTVATITTTTETAIAQIPTTTTPTQPLVVKQLIGQWEFTDPQYKQKLLFIFTEDNKFFLLEDPAKKPEPRALELRYKVVNASNKGPKQIDLGRNDKDLDETNQNSQPVYTIFDFTPDGKLRFQMQGVRPRQDRPQNFNDKALLLNKVSNSTELPKQVKIETIGGN